MARANQVQSFKGTKNCTAKQRLHSGVEETRIGDEAGGRRTIKRYNSQMLGELRRKTEGIKKGGIYLVNGYTINTCIKQRKGVIGVGKENCRGRNKSKNT